jgi:ribose 5-phosphate isomerase B
MARKIVLGSDHRGYQVKEQIAKILRDQGENVVDMGPHTDERSDYPDYAAKTARYVLSVDSSLGILVCSSGIGMSIAANKFPGIRAALCYQPELAALARHHNNANILCLSADFNSLETNLKNVAAWLEATFDGGRHAERLEKVHALEIAEKTG